MALTGSSPVLSTERESSEKDSPFLRQPSPSASLGSYAFEFSDGGQHGGQYELVYLESSVMLVLYPETGTAEYFGLIGTTLQTEYEVGQNNIREKCNGLRNCVWRRDSDG